ncbi:MAG: phosphate ABC transporter substrate-binding protein [Gaiellales bacterium]|nr:MAG: phosphate ABC transporter substrate-binding protein [Gaiellales bacterium]
MEAKLRLRKWQFIIAAALALAALAAAITGCGGTTGDTGGMLQVKGSDTMVNLSQMWAEKYMEENPAAQIAVTGGGSGTGISAMINGTADLANSSRQMKDEEVAEASSKGVEVEEHRVGLDGIAVIVHPDNPVKELSMQQLSDIFTGKITDWSQVGGGPGAIVLLSRESNSGTHVFFKEHVMNDQEYSPQALLMPSSQAIFEETRNNASAIGYVGLGYAQSGVKALGVSKDGSAAVAPSVETVQSGTYPVSRPLYIYSKKDASTQAVEFIDWIKGEEGQAVLLELDFVPLKG